MIYRMPWCCAECSNEECDRHYSNIDVTQVDVVTDYSVCCLNYRPKEEKEHGNRHQNDV